MKHNIDTLKHGDVIECGGTEGLPRSEFIVLASGMSAFNRKMDLCRVTRGYRLAGSCCTWVAQDYWARASYDFNGTRHSVGYKTLEEARAEFERFTTPIVAVTA